MYKICVHNRGFVIIRLNYFKLVFYLFKVFFALLGIYKDEGNTVFIKKFGMKFLYSPVVGKGNVTYAIFVGKFTFVTTFAVGFTV